MPRQDDDDADDLNPGDAANGQFKVEDQASGLASHFSEPNLIRDRSEEEEEEKSQSAAAQSESRLLHYQPGADVSMFGAIENLPPQMQSPQPAVSSMFAKPQDRRSDSKKRPKQYVKVEPTMAQRIQQKHKNRKNAVANNGPMTMQANRNKTPKKYGDVSDTSSLRKYSYS